MKRPWLITLEVVIVVAALVTVGIIIRRETKPSANPRGVTIKVQLEGARDSATLILDGNGSYHYRIKTVAGQAQNLTPQQFAERVYSEQKSRTWIYTVFNISSPAGFLWVTIGFAGQLLFTGRMIVQWLASEKSKRSVVPVAFWWMSLVGASMLLVYFIWRQDVIGVIGQATGWVIYVRNLILIYRPHAEAQPALSAAADPGPEPEMR